MFCNKCGAQLPDGSKFCTTCGASLEAPAQEPQYQAPQPEQQAYYQPDPQAQYQQGAYQQPQYQQPPYQQAPVSSKDKLTAGLLAIFLGSLGVHKFYLGYTKSAVIMLLVSLLTFGIGASVMGIIALVEGIIYLTKTEQEFYDTYVANHKEWF